MPSIPSSSYQHDDKNYHLNDLHQAMQYNVNGEPEIRVHASGITLSGNVSIGDVTIDNTVDNPVPVTIQNDCLSVQNCEGTTLSVSQGSNPWIISRNDQPNALGNEIFVKLTNDVVTVNLNNECLSVQNCAGTRLNTNSNSIIMLNELPVGGLNPFPVNITNTCLSVQNCGTDGVLNVSGAITVEGIAVTVENPFPVDLRNTCIGVENCEGTVLNVAGNISILSGEDPVSLLNPLPVNLTNECLSVQNCSGTRLNVNSNAIILINELPVAENNPFPVNITDTCLSVQNCGPDGVLNVSGAITVEGVEVTVETPFPVDLRNECLSVQNCAGTQLSVKLSDGVNNIGFVVNDNDGQSPGTYSVPVENFNMIWNGASWDRMPGNAISGVAVNITNSCLSVANCAESVLAIAGDVNVQIGGVDVSADNPVPVTIPNCVSIQNCGETTLGINGNVGLVYDNQVVDEGHPLPVTGTFEISDGRVQAILGGTNLDAFGRLRVSEPVTLFDSNFRYDDDTANWNHTLTGAGSSANYNSTTKTVDLSVNAVNGEVIRETTKVFQYQPGKSLLVMTTFAMSPDPLGEIEQRVGYFGADNGVYFQTIGNQYSLVIRKDIAGYVDSSTEKVLQNTWNGDRLTGLGGANNPSGYTLDPSLTQIFWMDIEWLGVGSVRCGFVINGQFILCHTFHHANIAALGLTGPYMATASLPIRYEIKRTGGEGPATMRQICSTVISEGGYQPKSTVDTASMGVTVKNLTTAGTYYPLVSIRLNSSRLDAIVRLATLQSMIATASSSPKNCHYKILRNATLTGNSWVTHPKGTVDYNLTLTGAVNGTIIGSGYFSASTRAEISGIADIDYQLGRTLSGVSDTFTIVAAPDTNNLDVAIDLGWFDLSL